MICLRFFNCTVWFVIALGLAAGCAKSDRAVLEKADSLIDQKKYSQAVTYIEEQLPSHRSNELKTKLAFAYLGVAGIELFEIASKVKFLKNFKEIKFDDAVSQADCDNTKASEKNSLSFNCMPFLDIPGFENPEDANLNKGISILTELFPNPKNTSPDKNLLIAILHLGKMVGNYNLIAKPPQKFLVPADQKTYDLRVEAATFNLIHTKRIYTDLYVVLDRLFNSYSKVIGFLGKYEGKPLFKIDGHTYYLTRDTSPQQLFEFMTDVRTAAIQKRRNVGNLSSMLQDVAERFHLEFLNGKESMLTSFSIKSLLAGAYFIPEKYKVDPKVAFPDPPELKEKNLPKSGRLLLDSFKVSWEQENAKELVDALDFLEVQAIELENIQSRWVNFYQRLDETGSENLKFQYAKFLNTIPALVSIIDPANGEPFISASKANDWYFNWNEKIEIWKNEMLKLTPEDPGVITIAKLIHDSHVWIDLNI